MMNNRLQHGGLQRQMEWSPIIAGSVREFGGVKEIQSTLYCSKISNNRYCLKNTMDSTADVLFGKTRQAVLTLLLEQPGRSFYVREMARLTGIGPGPLQAELTQLLKADLVQREKDGNRVTYQANTAHPAFADLQSLVGKTCGVPAQLRAALQQYAPMIRFAAIYGSMAKGSNHGRSDVDVLIVGDLPFDQAVAAVVPVEQRIAREISVRVLSSDEFRARLDRQEPFIKGVMDGPLIHLFGASNDA